MKHPNTFILHSSLYKETFDKICNNITWKPHHLELMASADTTVMVFYRTLLTEEAGQLPR